jgi:hypothetical protein
VCRLGAGQSGKSTLFKQMRYLYGEGFSPAERMEMKKVIAANTLQAAKTLVEQSRALGFDITDENKDAAAEVDDSPLDVERLTDDLADAVDRVWNDSGIQETYAHRSDFQLEDCASYFLSKAKEQAEASYCPSIDDVMRARVRTTGIVEDAFRIFDTPISMFDVGGQRNERKKWIHAFDGVNALIFVAAISEYDQVLFEDETKNRIDEAKELFAEISSNRFFKKKPIMRESWDELCALVTDRFRGVQCS